MHKKIESYKSRLLSAKYKITKQRAAIIETILEQANWHFTAEELFSEVKKNHPDIGLATVYRTLELFQELNIIDALELGGESKTYEVSEEEEHHHHLICKNCGKLVEFTDKDLEIFEQELAAKYNFQIDEHKLRFYGLCDKCRN